MKYSWMKRKHHNPPTESFFFNMQMFYVHHETFVVINSGSHCAAWRVSVIQHIGILVEKPYQPTEEVLFTQPL